MDRLSEGDFYKDALGVFGREGITEDVFKELLADAERASIALKVRIYYALSRAMQAEGRTICGMTCEDLETKCFGTIERMIYEDAAENLPDNQNLKICKEQVSVRLPVRVNWGGGWTDTPLQCIEMGGAVLNAAIMLRGVKPIWVTVRKLDELKVEFESQDVGVKGEAHSTAEIRDCHNPYDPFALHKAALIACGIVPLEGEEPLEEILGRLGGGIYLSTQVVGIPKGSGLGTSSILSAACVKALYEFLGLDSGDGQVSQVVLCMEQIMSTGGGWQDQVGGYGGNQVYTIQAGCPPTAFRRARRAQRTDKTGAAGEVCADLHRAEKAGEKSAAGCGGRLYRGKTGIHRSVEGDEAFGGSHAL